MSLSLLYAAVEGFGLGGSLIIAIGAQNAFVLKQGLLHRHVFVVAGLCFLIDATLIGIGAGGFASIITAYPALPAIAAWGGAAFLFVYGCRALLAAIAPGQLNPEDAPKSNQSLAAAVSTTLAVSLLNPHVYLDTVVLIGSISSQFPPTDRIAFALGAMTASFVWFYGLGYGARRLTPVFAKPSAWRLLDLCIAFIMWSIAAGLVLDQLG